MKLLLREITHSDNSKERRLIVNNEQPIGHIRITVKQWKTLSKLGIHSDKKVLTQRLILE